MKKIELTKPVLLVVYGLPKSGKSFLANALVDFIDAAQVTTDKVTGTLLHKQSGSPTEKKLIASICKYLATEFMRSKVSVVYDIENITNAHRQEIRGIALKNEVIPVTVWVQTDTDTVMNRMQKFNPETGQNDAYYNNLFNKFAPPHENNVVVVSGKHSADSQRMAILKKLTELQVVKKDDVANNVVKPGMVNLLSGFTPRGDLTRRNISVRGLSE